MILLVFSKDRPLQLAAALGSFRRHCRDGEAAEVKVLYKAVGSRMLSLYHQVAREFPAVDFVREGDFRRDVLLLLQGHEHIGFVVDDTIFARDFSLRAIGAALEANATALGYSLRLGRNTTYCYSFDRAQQPPEFLGAQGACQYRWPSAAYDFGYPLELSSSVYRGPQILPLLKEIEFKNPNTLEESMARQANRFRESHPLLLCAEHSLAFSVPANKVQDVCSNRAGENPEQSAGTLAELFAQGRRIVLEEFDNFTPNACHQVVDFKLAAAAPPVPRVSVVIPCYMQAAYLPEAVASVAAQTFADLEIIIVNDGSPDETGTAARRLIEEYPAARIRLVEKKNEGLARARNAGIAAATGAYILPLDADDKIEPLMLEKTAALLEASPEVAVAYTDVVHFGAAQKVVQAAEYDFRKLCRNNQLNYCSLYRREVWEQVGGYNPDRFCGYEDWDFWIACGARGFVARRIPGAFFHYRVKEASMYTTAMAHDKELRARIVLSHPALYDAPTVQDARKLWSARPMPRPPGAPLVTVVVPTYNRPGQLREALRSVLNQTFQDYEIIVVNDNGIDVEHVLAGLYPRERIVHLRHSANRGLAAARNSGCRLARGKYLAYLDDDDVFLPDHFETLVTFLENTGSKAAYTDAYRAEEKMEEGRKTAQRAVTYSSDWNNDAILVSNIAPVLCFMHERGLGIATGEFDETLTTHEDWDYWIRLSRLCQPVHIKKVTCEFRVAGDGSSMTGRLRPDFLRTAQIIFRKYKPYAAGNKEVLRKQQRVLRKLKKDLGQEGFGAWLRGWTQRFGGKGG
jgi:glycosyltransferase involved in cell wall biosynthesis